MADIEYSVVNKVAWIKLNRPQLKNSFTLEMVDQWAGFLWTAKEDADVGAVVVTGSADSFCSGVDLAVMRQLIVQNDGLAWKNLLWERVHRVAFAIEQIDKPVIAAVNGAAVGAGMDMSLMCDMRFASRSARFCEGYIRIGAVPGDGGCYFLPRIVGRAKALELLLSGEFVDADEALRIGLVNRVYDDETLLASTQAFAEMLVSHNPLTIRMTKRAVYQSEQLDMRTSLDLISSHMGVVQTQARAASALATFRIEQRSQDQEREA